MPVFIATLFALNHMIWLPGYLLLDSAQQQTFTGFLHTLSSSIHVALLTSGVYALQSSLYSINEQLDTLII